jgi:hypothetical protein
MVMTLNPPDGGYDSSDEHDKDLGTDGENYTS